MNVIRDIVYGEEDLEAQKLDIYLPEGEATDLVIYFHGGALEEGDKSNNRLEGLAGYGKAVISANYRMYPEAVFPQFIEDAALAVKWAKEHIREYAPVRRIFVAGSSAGAYLTAMLAFDRRDLGKHGIDTLDISGYVINSGQMTTHFNVLRERGIDTRRILVDEAAPVYFLDENTVFPNIFVIVADNDMPCRLEQNRMFLKTLEMFECPPEKVRFKLMEAYTHCQYDKTPIYADMVNEFVDATKD